MVVTSLSQKPSMVLVVLVGPQGGQCTGCSKRPVPLSPHLKLLIHGRSPRVCPQCRCQTTVPSPPWTS